MEKNSYECQSAGKILDYGLIPLNCKTKVGEIVILLWHEALDKYKGDLYYANVDGNVLEIKNHADETFFALSIENHIHVFANLCIADKEGFLITIGYYNQTGLNYFNVDHSIIFNGPICKSLGDSYNGIKPKYFMESVYVKVDKKFEGNEFIIISPQYEVGKKFVYSIKGEVTPFESSNWLSRERWKNKT